MHRSTEWDAGTLGSKAASGKPNLSEGECLHVFGLNHRTAPMAIRERFACGSHAFHAIIRALGEHCCEQVPLGTCNRSEWICLADAGSRQACWEAFQRISELTDEEMQKHFYCHVGRPALEHLCEVASGLDSLVLGETQILGQVKDAFNLAFEMELAGRKLMPLYHQVLHIAKTVRRTSHIGEGTLSYGSLTVQAARNTFGDISTCKVALIGAGKMSRLAGTHLAEAGVGSIRVLNRNQANGAELAKAIGAVHLPIDQLASSLAWADVIVSATACPHCIISAEDVASVLATRDGKPLCLVDLAMPRDIEPAIGEDARVSLYDIDAFQKLIAANQQARVRQRSMAQELIREKVGLYMAESQVDLGSVMKALQDRSEQLRDEEFQRLCKRFDHWSAEERDQVAQSMRLLLTRFLHAPVKSLREEVTSEPNPAFATNPIAYFSRLFKLEVDRD